METSQGGGSQPWNQDAGSRIRNAGEWTVQMIRKRIEKDYVNSRRTRDDIDRLEKLADSRGWRSIAQAQEITSRAGMEYYEHEEEIRNASPETAEMLDWETAENRILDIWTHLTPSARIKFSSLTETLHKTRYDTSTELRRQLAEARSQ